MSDERLGEKYKKLSTVLIVGRLLPLWAESGTLKTDSKRGISGVLIVESSNRALKRPSHLP